MWLCDSDLCFRFLYCRFSLRGITFKKKTVSEKLEECLAKHSNYTGRNNFFCWFKRGFNSSKALKITQEVK